MRPLIKSVNLKPVEGHLPAHSHPSQRLLAIAVAVMTVCDDALHPVSHAAHLCGVSLCFAPSMEYSFLSTKPYQKRFTAGAARRQDPPAHTVGT